MARILAGISVVGVVFFGGVTQAGGLTFEDRVKAQESIERVYYSHRLGATVPFHEVVTRSVLEKEVTRYLEQSVALEALWGIPVTSDMLEQEMERQARETMMPDRLRELYVALGSDTVLIQECLARPALVDRLVRSRFVVDRAIHKEARQSAESVRLDLVGGQIDPYHARPGRIVVDLVRMEAGQRANAQPQQRNHGLFEGNSREEHEATAAEFEAWRESAPRVPGEIGPVQEENGAFVVRVLLKDEPDRTSIATFLVSKTNFEDWWKAAEAGLDASAVRTVASAAPLPNTEPSAHSSTITARTSDSRHAGKDPLGVFVVGRWDHSAVWTGSEMILWGGFPVGQGATGARYDPATDAWKTTTMAGAPRAREDHKAIWTGNEMIVWGGQDQDGQFPTNTGGRYNPTTDTWTSTTTLGAPQGRVGHAALWTGRFMIVWGGGGSGNFKNGGRYDPVRDKWLRIRTGGAPSSGGNTAVWTGNEMIVWGGASPRGYLNTGARYEPTANTWVPISTVGAPTPRSENAAVWTGREMIVWSGSTDIDGTPGTGGRYDPATDTWVAISQDGAPLSRTLPYGAWTGSEMIVWGGVPHLNTGGRYDPVSDSWTPTSIIGAPAGKDGQSANWCGTLFIVWGGDNTNAGGRYDPLTDSWTPTAAAAAYDPQWQSAN